MSVSMAKKEGSTVFTVTFDPQSRSPPLCQIFKALCYSPVCCSVSENVRRLQGSSQSVLGCLQIMVGVLNVGLGAVLLCAEPTTWWKMAETWCPIWLGLLFMAFGIVCILSEKFPSQCLVTFNVLMNVAGVAFAVAAIVLYSFSMANVYVDWMCREGSSYDYDEVTTTAAPVSNRLMERCLAGKALILMLLRSVHVVLIVLSALELCIAISAAVLGTKTLKNCDKGEIEAAGDPQLYKPLLEEVATI